MTIKLVKTCTAYPEQYDAYENGERVGYLRLRHGHFRVDCPVSGGETVFRAEPRGDGMFEDDERDFHLTCAVLAIRYWVVRRAGGGEPLYEIDDRDAV
ncbi:hypothetical protein [Methylobacterium sp. 092160098-2]|jgi:hypothetical protein|uniref:hypothetical protein n=1 Tax=Methylobacterium sp. 092160098-2 TaxID=3025129 RepID=UPI002381B117|nr:hypothetical protein [Methylobacterium sp. 092160098-2]MDE4914815.1 hypothetical protein [Methylobacterium sp. 092160098-2]